MLQTPHKAYRAGAAGSTGLDRLGIHRRVAQRDDGCTLLYFGMQTGSPRLPGQPDEPEVEIIHDSRR